MSLSPQQAERLRGLRLDFEARFLEAALERRPEWTHLLTELGHVYTRLGRYAEGLAVDRRLVKMFPHDPDVRYNLACSLALLSRPDAALDELERAVELGYRNVEFMLEDEDLAPLRGLVRFEAIARRLARP